MNLSKHLIAVNVSNLLQLGDKFSLPYYTNKKDAIHQFIKDLEGNTNRFFMDSQIKIRNIVVPYFYKILKHEKSPIKQKLIFLFNATKQFCRNNPNIIFTKADKGNTTIALDKDSYK